MSDLLRVPPGVDFAFEKRVNDVLEQAKPDYNRLPSMRTELMEHLRERWRQGIERNLSTEAAEEQALESFGNSETVGKSLREVWWRRLLTYRRYRAERFLVMVSSSIWASYWILAYAPGAGEFSKEMQESIQQFRYGTFLNVVFALCALSILSLRIKFRYTVLRWVFKIRHCLWVFVISYGLNLLVLPFVYLMDGTFPLRLQSPGSWLELAIAGSLFLGCGLAFLCLCKEVKETICLMKKQK